MPHESRLPRSVDAARYWRALARRSALRNNIAWWLVYFLPCALAFATGAASYIVLVRSRGSHEGALVWPLLGCALAGCAIVCYLVARRRFLRLKDGLVRIEIAMRLHNRLSTAHSEAGPWPEVEPHLRVDDGLDWRWTYLCSPALVGILLLLAATMLPVARTTRLRPPVEPPLSVTQVEAWIEKMKRDELASQSKLDELEAQLEQLRSLDSTEWYDHSALEAADNLRDKTKQAMQELRLQLQETEGLVSELRDGASSLSNTEMEGLRSDLGKALEKLGSGALPPGQSMQSSQELRQSGTNSLSPEQTERLLDELRKGSARLGEALDGSASSMADAVETIQPGSKQAGPGLPKSGAPGSPQPSTGPPKSASPGSAKQSTGSPKSGSPGSAQSSKQGSHSGSSPDGQPMGAGKKSGTKSASTPDGQEPGSSGSEVEGGSCESDSGRRAAPGSAAGQSSGAGQTSGQGTIDPPTAGTSRGPGSSALGSLEQPPKLTSNRIDALPRQERDSDEPGQMLGLSARAPERSLDASGADGGSTTASGNKNDVVWRDVLVPAEREVLERFFK